MIRPGPDARSSTMDWGVLEDRVIISTEPPDHIESPATSFKPGRQIYMRFARDR
jgi:hypothetical protein